MKRRLRRARAGRAGERPAHHETVQAAGGAERPGGEERGGGVVEHAASLPGEGARMVWMSTFDAENAVKRIEGVERVDNQIQVLPTSPMDDQIRQATYRAIYGNSVLSPYGLRAVPPIHIIVNQGHVTLEGVVAKQMDKQVAEVQAKSVPNVFSVTNNLQVEE